MYWNYRVCRVEIDHDVEPYQYVIKEVHYNENGEIANWIHGESSPYGESLEELQSDLERMAEAFKRPMVVFDKNGKLVEIES